MKRLEKQKFAPLWREGSGDCVELSPSELSLFIEGCSLAGWQRWSPEIVGPKVLVSSLPGDIHSAMNAEANMSREQLVEVVRL